VFSAPAAVRPPFAEFSPAIHGNAAPARKNERREIPPQVRVAKPPTSSMVDLATKDGTGR
jgi:hypothetical protein